MCPDCKAMAEELGQLKLLLVEQQRALVGYDAMSEQGKLATLGPMPGGGVMACSEVAVETNVTMAALTRAQAGGRAEVQRLIHHATESMKDELLAAIRPRIRFAEVRENAFSSSIRHAAYLMIGDR